MNTQTFATRLSTLSPPRREGLTAIFRKAQERVLPTATGWLNPEDSIGRYIGKAKWDHIWEAIGPARDAFNRVAPKIKDYLESAVEPISSKVTWSMYMIGKSASLASPSIIFCCDVLQHRRDVRNTVKDSGILNDYPGIKTGHLPRPPDFDQLVPLGAEGQLPYNRGDIMALTSPTKSACGSQLFIYANESNSVPLAATATIGGVIRLGEKCYYTTAAHALAPTPDPVTADEALPTDDDYDTDGDTLSLDGSEDMYSAATSGPRAGDPRPWNPLDRIGEPSEDNQYMRDDTLRHRRHVTQEPRSSLVYPGGLSLKPIGRPFMSSMEGGNRGAGLDYALMEISSKNHVLENVISVGTNTKATVKVHSVVRSEPRNEDIVAVTPRGITKGWISGTPTYSSVPGKRQYYRMLKVSLEDPLERGDCGTWVVNAANGDLFGHVVLGFPGGGNALLTPFSDIFDDILSKSGKIPTFPMAQDDENSFRSAEARTPPITRDESFSHIIRNTISLMGESPKAPSAENNIADKRGSETTTESKSQIEGRFDLRKGKEKSEEPAKQMLSETESGTKDLNVSKNDGAVQTESSLDHAQQPVASKPDSATDDWVDDISEKFGRLMVHKRVKPSRQLDRVGEVSALAAVAQGNLSLTEESTSKQSSTILAQSSQPPSYIPLRIERPESPPRPSYYEFRDVLFSLSKVPIGWESAELLDLALQEINLKSIFSEAEEENDVFISQARSKGLNTKPKWGYQDCVVQALLRYFSRSFFTRVDNPPCEACASKLPTMPRGNAQPTPTERAGKVEAVELYRCAEKHCQAYTRFPRYWDVGTLLKIRRGRLSEGANCFGLLCRALGSRVRWVWNPENNIWTEVYSEHQQRWVHVDPCSATWDNPLLYTEGMGRELSYCVAFSSEGATDVTRRYVRASRHALARTECSEPELLRIIHHIKSMRCRDMSNEELLRLDREDAAEAQELESYTVPADALGSAGDWHQADVNSGMITPRTNSRETLNSTYSEKPCPASSPT